MSRTLLETSDLRVVGSTMAGVHIGRIVGFSPDGEPLVNYPGNEEGPLVARLTTTAADFADSELNREVLLVFERGDPGRPIVLDFVEARSGPRETIAAAYLHRDRYHNVTVDGRKVELTGSDQVVLSCGKSSITLHADGRVIVKGTRLVSRASESNKIKGATIALN